MLESTASSAFPIPTDCDPCPGKTSPIPDDLVDWRVAILRELVHEATGYSYHLENQTGAAYRAAPMALDIVESPLNVNGKSSRGAISHQESVSAPDSGVIATAVRFSPLPPDERRCPGQSGAEGP